MIENSQPVFNSNVFALSNTVLTTRPSECMGMSFADYYQSLKRENGGPFDIVDENSHGYYVNNYRDFNDKQFVNTEKISARMYPFSKFITHQQICGEGERLGIFKRYATGDALMLAGDAARQNLIEPGYGIIIYLDIPESPYYFHRIRAYHCMDGKKGINFYQASKSGEWCAGDGVLYDDLQ